MEDREGKNKFWKGILIGALATALFGLIAVTAAAGIWIMGRMTANQLGAASLAENENGDGGEEGTESPETLDMSRIGTKLTYMNIFCLTKRKKRRKERDTARRTGFMPAICSR